VKIAIFSDVHGNYVNLKAFYDSMRLMGIDSYICLGDLCNYYPDNNKVIDFIKDNAIRCLLGNHDELYISGNHITEEKKTAYNFDLGLTESEEHISFLRTLPLNLEMTVSGKSILFCHGAPDDYLYTYVYPDSNLQKYAEIPHSIVFMGHTHRQFLREYAGKIFCNVGSIGLPRDNGSLMSFAVFNTFDLTITLYRKKTDLPKIKKEYGHNTPRQVLDLLERTEEIHYSYSLI
jgi:putative phosphoesterase